jgi:prolipoprotein diacylglyceryl transferase
MAAHSRMPLSFIPSPSINGFHIGPLFIHFYGLMYVVGIVLAVIIAQRRIKRMGGDPGLIGDIALWAVPAGIIGGRIYFDVTTPNQIPHEWYGVFAVWSGGLGIWGGVLAGALVGAWRVRRAGGNVPLYADAIAPALLVAQAVGRIGNYFNKELFGGPTKLPWALVIPLQYRPAGYTQYRTFEPTFLYELIWDLALAAFLVWLGHHRTIKPPGLFALYVAGYSAFRIYEESVRIDNSEHFLGLRTNFYVATVLTVVGITWFVISQRRGQLVPAPPGDDGGDDAAAHAPADGSAGAGEGDKVSPMAGPGPDQATDASETVADGAVASETVASETVASETVASERN